jgi:hypothetical protein
VNRIFVSYRTSDAKKDADRLAFDLERVFGEDQVFFDKHDLHGGAAWRDAIGQALGERPIVLLVMTPELFGAVHPEGGPRIQREDDPIRGELLVARQHGALIVPLLTEGMTMPSRAVLPEPLDFITEAHALKLRTDDWAHDLDRLITDLTRQGVVPRAAPQGVAAPVPAVEPAGAMKMRTVWWLFWGALLLWLYLVYEADNTLDPDTYMGDGIGSFIALGVFVYVFLRLRAIRSGVRWVVLAVAMLCGLTALGLVIGHPTGHPNQQGAATPEDQRPPLTSITAPVV